MGKKLFSVILSIVLCLSLSISAFAQEAGTTTFAMEGKEYTLYVRDNVSVVTEVETGVRASFDNSTYTLKVYENSDAQPIVIQLPKTATYASNATRIMNMLILRLLRDTTISHIHSGRFKYRTTSNTHMKLITHRL